MNHQIERHGSGISKWHWHKLRHELVYPAVMGLIVAAAMLALILLLDH